MGTGGSASPIPGLAPGVPKNACGLRLAGCYQRLGNPRRKPGDQHRVSPGLRPGFLKTHASSAVACWVLPTHGKPPVETGGSGPRGCGVSSGFCPLAPARGFRTPTAWGCPAVGSPRRKPGYQRHRSPGSRPGFPETHSASVRGFLTTHSVCVRGSLKHIGLAPRGP